MLVYFCVFVFMILFFLEIKYKEEKYNHASYCLSSSEFIALSFISHRYLNPSLPGLLAGPSGIRAGCVIETKSRLGAE